MTTHVLKTWPEYYQAIIDGTKPFEVRQNDRGFAVGDVLLLQEYDPKTDKCTGRATSRTVTYLLEDEGFTSQPDCCVMGLAASAPSLYVGQNTDKLLDNIEELFEVIPCDCGRACRECDDDYQEGYKFDWNGTNEEAIDYLAQLLRANRSAALRLGKEGSQDDNWISVDGRLPAQRGHVAVLLADGSVIGCYCDPGFAYDEDGEIGVVPAAWDGGLYNGKVIAWQPLPAAPSILIGDSPKKPLQLLDMGEPLPPVQPCRNCKKDGKGFICTTDCDTQVC